MKLIYNLLTLAIIICPAASAHSENCLEPKINLSRVALSYGASSGDSICLSRGPKIQVLSVRKSRIKFKLTDYPKTIVLAGRPGSLLRYYGNRSVKIVIGRVSTRNNRLRIIVDILPLSDSAICLPRMQTECISPTVVVCALDSFGHPKAYTSPCAAAQECAQIVEPIFCGLGSVISD